jgi:hypothetical protein
MEGFNEQESRSNQGGDTKVYAIRVSGTNVKWIQDNDVRSRLTDKVAHRQDFEIPGIARKNTCSRSRDEIP